MVAQKYLVLLSMSGLLVSVDQYTKNIVTGRFRLGESLPLLENFLSLTRVHNTGAAFGVLAGLPPHIREPFFYLVPGLTLTAILIVFSRLKDSQFLNIYSLAMIVGGALGNLVDRVRLGYVVDFVDFHWQMRWHFPAFNVADAGISLGVFFLLIGMLRERDENHVQPQD